MSFIRLKHYHISDRSGHPCWWTGSIRKQKAEGRLKTGHTWVFIMEWGRDGDDGQCREKLYSTEVAAKAALKRGCEKRESNGYTLEIGISIHPGCVRFRDSGGYVNCKFGKHHAMGLVGRGFRTFIVTKGGFDPSGPFENAHPDDLPEPPPTTAVPLTEDSLGERLIDAHAPYLIRVELEAPSGFMDPGVALVTVAFAKGTSSGMRADLIAKVGHWLDENGPVGVHWTVTEPTPLEESSVVPTVDSVEPPTIRFDKTRASPAKPEPKPPKKKRATGRQRLLPTFDDWQSGFDL